MLNRSHLLARQHVTRWAESHDSVRLGKTSRRRLLWTPNRVRARWPQQVELFNVVANEIETALNELADLREAVASGRVVSYARDPESVEGNGNGHELTMTHKVSKRDRARYPRD